MDKTKTILNNALKQLVEGITYNLQNKDQKKLSLKDLYRAITTIYDNSSDYKQIKYSFNKINSLFNDATKLLAGDDLEGFKQKMEMCVKVFNKNIEYFSSVLAGDLMNVLSSFEEASNVENKENAKTLINRINTFYLDAKVEQSNSASKNKAIKLINLISNNSKLLKSNNKSNIIKGCDNIIKALPKNKFGKQALLRKNFENLIKHLKNLKTE